MRRRTLLQAAVASTAATTLCDRVIEPVAASATIPPVMFDSTASLLDERYGELTDETVVAVWVEDTATNVDGDGDGYGTVYAEATSIPVVAKDGNVVGFGSMLVDDGTNWQRGNEEFVLNVWDAEVGGGTVLWDEGHGQYYALSKFSAFEAYAEDRGYDVRATSSLRTDLSASDAAVVTSPSTAFTTAELRILSDFVGGGGALFLHDQSDYANYDETANLNDIAGYLGLAFRFNDDGVLDEIVNAGEEYQPLTDEFNATFGYFADRSGLGLDPTVTYTTTVDSVIDGDTVDVALEGARENVRVLGIDTPEKSNNSQFERVEEWEGIDDQSYLETWGANATDYAKVELAGETVDVSFDPNEPVRDGYGRVLAYVHYDADGDGARDDLYNYNAVRDGYARVYDSGFSKHGSFRDAEEAARGSGVGVWERSDPENTPEIRNRPVDDLFFPTPSSVRTTAGALPSRRTLVRAEATASQEAEPGVTTYDEIPLAGVDETARVALVGAPIVDERYEAAEGYEVDTSGYENFVFLSNLVNYLSSTTGEVLVDGGHGQFGATYGLAAEDAAYYLRYLEGVGVGFEGVNELSSARLSGARALLVTPPAEALARSELDALASFRDDGGAVVLLGTGWLTAGARENLNGVAEALGTDLRLNADHVTDDTNNVNGDPEVPTTTRFAADYPLWGAYDGTMAGGSADLVIVTVHADAEGDEYDNLNDEYVVFENVGTEPLVLTDWQVRDEVEKTYTFNSISLASDARLTLHTGDGSDTETDVYWGRSSPVWNNSGDTCYVYDDAGALVTSKTY